MPHRPGPVGPRHDVAADADGRLHADPLRPGHALGRGQLAGGQDRADPRDVDARRRDEDARPRATRAEKRAAHRDETRQWCSHHADGTQKTARSR